MCVEWKGWNNCVHHAGAELNSWRFRREIIHCNGQKVREEPWCNRPCWEITKTPEPALGRVANTVVHSSPLNFSTCPGTLPETVVMCPLLWQMLTICGNLVLTEPVSLFSCEMGLPFRKISEIYMCKSFISLGLAGRWCSTVGVCLFVYPFFSWPFLGLCVKIKCARLSYVQRERLICESWHWACSWKLAPWVVLRAPFFSCVFPIWVPSNYAESLLCAHPAPSHQARLPSRESNLSSTFPWEHCIHISSSPEH